MRRLNCLETMLIGMAFGVWLAFQLFGSAFALPHNEFYYAVSKLMFLTAVVSATLGALSASSWAVVAIAVSLPNTAMESFFIAQSVIQQRASARDSAISILVVFATSATMVMLGRWLGTAGWKGEGRRKGT